MKKNLIILLIVVLQGCVSLKKHNQVKDNLQSELIEISDELEKKRSKLKKLGNLDITDKATQSDKSKALAYKDDNSWVPLENAERYKNYLTKGLGIIWLEIGKDSLIEGGYVNLDNYQAEPEIIDQGDIIFKYFVNNEFATDISVVSIVTSSIESKDIAKLKYEILGTSRLKIPQDSIESIAKKYADNRYGNNIIAVYLATGFHIRKISLQTYTKMAADAVATVPVANVGGTFYNESESELNNWYVDAKLIDLSFFLPKKELEEANVLNENQTPFQFLKSSLGDSITDRNLQIVANNPEIMINEKEFKNLFGEEAMLKIDTNKLNDIGKSLIKAKSNLFEKK